MCNWITLYNKGTNNILISIINWCVTYDELMHDLMQDVSQEFLLLKTNHQVMYEFMWFVHTKEFTSWEFTITSNINFYASSHLKST